MLAEAARPWESNRARLESTIANLRHNFNILKFLELHFPQVCIGDVPGTFRGMVSGREKGLSKSSLCEKGPGFAGLLL